MRALIALPLAALLFAGCGGDAPTNFPAAHGPDLTPGALARVNTVMEAWIQAQRNMDEDALEDLYLHGYHFNGMTAHDMAEVHLLPETPDTRITSITWQLLEGPEHDHDHHAHAHAVARPAHEHDHDCDHDHHALVMARIQLKGVVSASVIAELATEVGDAHDHGDAHAHQVAPAHGHDHDHAELKGTVKVEGHYDVVFLMVWNHGEPAFIAEQWFEMAALEFGGGLAAPVLRDIHVNPEDAHPGEELDVHGRYAMMPPGGLMRARVGWNGHHDHDDHHGHAHSHGVARPAHGHDHHDGDDHHVDVGEGWAQVEYDHGEFRVHLEAPHHEGEYLVRVEAYAGNVESRTASLTIVEREVHVDDHHDHH